MLDAFVLRLRTAANPQQLYDSIAGKTAAGCLTLPSEADIAAFHRFIDRAADALAQDPEAAGRALAAIEKDRSALHAFYQGAIPMLGRINETRGSVKSERDRTLTLLK